MPLPLIPVLLGGASLLAGAIGVKKGLDAKEDFDRAERIAENAKRSHERAISNLATDKELTNEKIQDLIKLKVDIFQDQIKHLVDTVKRCYKNSKSTMENFEETISIDDIKRMEEMVVSTGSGVASSALEGLFAGSKAVAALVALSGGATGTTLAGGTLAMLGGGALAAGGLGVGVGTGAAGGLGVGVGTGVLLGSFVGPALAVGGFTLANKAEKAVTEAREYEADAEEKIAKIGKVQVILQGLRTNVDEMSSNLRQLANTFDKYKVSDNSDKSAFDRMLKVGKSIKALLDMHIIEDDGTAVKDLKVKMSGYMQV